MTSLSAATAATNHLRQVWQIGTRDSSAQEFRRDWDFSEEKYPNFVVGRDKPEQHWSAFHPGALNSTHGPRTHPFTIVFRLDRAPTGTLYLTVDAMFKTFLARDLPIPQYRVEINGRTGRFYFHPKLSYDIGDPYDALDINFSTAHLEIALPATYFREGENRLVLTCVGDSSDGILPHDPISSADSGIHYDALALTNSPHTRYNENELAAKAFPTIFYRSHGVNQLSEVVVLEARAASRLEQASASLLLRDQSYTCQLASGYDFGESQCVLEIPEFTSATPARLTVRTIGRSRSFRFSLTPQKKFKLFLVPQIHLDLGYTDYRPNTQEVNNRSLDFIIKEAEAHPQYRYTPDGSWILHDYFAHRGAGWQRRLMNLLQEERISLPAQLFNVNTGLMSQEELNHLGYFSEEIRRRYGIAYEDANLSDVPAHTWALPSYLQSIGVKHLVVGSDPWRGPITIHGRLNQLSPFFWEGPDGRKVLTWYARLHAQTGALFGAPPSVSAGVNALPIFLQDYASPSYVPDAVMLYGTQTENVPFDARTIAIADAWNKEFAYPNITISNSKDFFGYMEQNYRGSLRTLRGDGGAWWEEMAASDAYHSGMIRRAKARVIAAETLASLGVIVNDDFKFPLHLDRQIWADLLLYAEHSWGRVFQWSRPESELGQTLQRNKQSFGTGASKNVDDMLRRGFDQLYSRINARDDLVVVFNPLSWRRAGLVEVEIPRGSGLTDLTTRQPVSLELVRGENDEEYDRVRFWAEDVPSVGYRSYAVRTRSSAGPAQELSTLSEPVIENRHYRITADPSRGGILSIYDKRLGRELVDRGSPYALGQYVYAGYGHEDVSLIRQRKVHNSTLLQYSNALPLPNLKVEGAGNAKIVAIKTVPWGTALIMQSSAVHTPVITTEIRLFEHEGRIELINTVHKEEVRAPEAVYFAFPFASQNPTMRYEIQNSWVNLPRDQLPGANKEWFAAQHWVAVSDDEKATIVLALNEAPLFTIGDIVRGRWPTALEIRNGTVFSYIMNNYDGDDERPYQGGTFTFHYVIGSVDRFDPTALTRLGIEANRPLEVYASALALTRTGIPSEPLSPMVESFLQIEDPAVILSAWKGAEDGNGYILRFYNTSDRSVTTTIEFPNLYFDSLNRTNAVEVDQGAILSQQGAIAVTLHPHEVYSLRVNGFRVREPSNQ